MERRRTTTTLHHEVTLANPAAEIGRLRAANHAGAGINFVSIESYLAWLPNDDVLRIFQEIGNLQRLKTFRISFSFQRFRQLPVLPIPSQALIRLLHLAQNLETLTLDECRFVFPSDHDHDHDDDNEHNLPALARALQQTPKLRHVTLFNCFPHHHHQQQQEQQEQHNHTYSQLARSISQIPSLQELNLIYTTLEGPDQWIPSLLQHSCDSQSLQILRINVPDGSLPLPAMCQSFPTLPTVALQQLSLRCPLDQSAGIALAQALSSTSLRHSLQKLYLQTKSYDYAIPIVHALPHTTVLHSMELRVWTGLGDRTFLLQALETILPHHQWTLQRFELDNGRHSLTPTIEFYLKLNRAGRQALKDPQRANNPELWMEFLRQCREINPDDPREQQQEEDDEDDDNGNSCHDDKEEEGTSDKKLKEIPFPS